MPGVEQQIGPDRSLDELLQRRLLPPQLGVVGQLVGQSRGVREQVENLHGFLALAGELGNIALTRSLRLSWPRSTRSIAAM